MTEEYVKKLYEFASTENPDTPMGKTKPDMVNHPSHYNQGKYEVINIIKEFTKDLHGIIATDTGNIIKYILRWPKKNGIEDLKKARWYLDHLINELETKGENEDEG